MFMCEVRYKLASGEIRIYVVIHDIYYYIHKLADVYTHIYLIDYIFTALELNILQYI